MPITIISKQRAGSERASIHTDRITLSMSGDTHAAPVDKFSVVIANLPVALTYKELKAQVFADFDGLYQKVSDGVFIAVLKDKAQVMKFCKKYNLASVDGQEIRCVPIIKLDYENIVDVQLKQ